MTAVTLRLGQHGLTADAQRRGPQQNLIEPYGYVQSPSNPNPVEFPEGPPELIPAKAVARDFAELHSRLFLKLEKQIELHPLDLVHKPKSPAGVQTSDYFYVTGQNLTHV